MVNEKTTTNSSVKHDLPPNWHAQDTFSGDELIDAYFKGKEAGMKVGWDEKFQILVNQFKKNLDSAVKISEDLYKEVLENGISLKTIHLRADGLTKFTSLFVADMNDYVSDNFLKVQSIARKYKGHNKNPELYMSFLFMPYSEQISKDCLTADGYVLSYDKDK